MALSHSRAINVQSVTKVFTALAHDCKTESATRQLGAPDEVASIMDSFTVFIRDCFFADTTLYPFADGTNRHGIAHGAYSDADYGSPINFYKTIAAVDFLTFVACFNANLSWLAPNSTPESIKLAAYFRGLRAVKAAAQRPISSRAL